MKKSKLLTEGAIIAALYVIFTIIGSFIPVSYGIRPSEVLNILCLFLPSAVPGLFVGCIISNIILGCTVYDIVFGSLATLIGAYLCFRLRKNKFAGLIFPTVSNTVILPLVLFFTYGLGKSVGAIAFTVFISEFISSYIIPLILYPFADKIIKRQQNTKKS